MTYQLLTAKTNMPTPRPDNSPMYHIDPRITGRFRAFSPMAVAEMPVNPETNESDEESDYNYSDMEAQEESQQDYLRRVISRCGSCPTEVTDENEATFTWIDSNQMTCQLCLQRNYYDCIGCHTWHYLGNRYVIYLRGGSSCVNSCQACASRMLADGTIYSCRSCGGAYYADDPRIAMRDRCQDCADRMIENGDIVWRNYASKPELITKTAGKKLQSTRAFGIELETFYSKNKKKAATTIYNLPPYVGVGEDGSIKGGNGVEVKTPPASGIRAEAMIEDVCASMIKGGFAVNTSCGYHIHIDVASIDSLSAERQLNAVKSLWLTYLAFEDVILSFLPPSRRTNQRYCAPLKSEYHVDEIAKVQNMDALEQLWYRINSKEQITRAKADHHHASRYRGINLHPLFSGRHLEIRYHSGTLNTTKILEWANLHLKIVDWALQSTLEWGAYKSLANNIDIDTKMDTLLGSIAKLSPESIGYFLARREMFRNLTKITETAHFKSGMKILSDEQES